MKTLTIMRADQLERFARFLEEHPGFSPLLHGEDASVFGFQTGHCLLAVDEMEKLIAAQPRFDAEQAALLLCPAARRG